MTGIHFCILEAVLYIIKRQKWIQKKSEGSVTLYYELYLDSLFFTDFIMNFYLLGLTNRIRGRSATRLRRFAGAAYGAGIYCMIFLLPSGWPVGKILAGLIVSGVGMAVITFQAKAPVQIGKTLLVMAGAAFFLGGIYFFLRDRIPVFKEEGVLKGVVLGGVAYGAGCFLLEKGKRKISPECSVILQGVTGNITVEALLDTGNSLTEPVSGRPVSILDEKMLLDVFDGQLPEYYRVVPFASIGKKKGLLKCFEIPKIWVTYQENERVYEKVLVACSEEFAPKEGFRMLLNPRLIKNQEEKNDDI